MDIVLSVVFTCLVIYSISMTGMCYLSLKKVVELEKLLEEK